MRGGDLRRSTSRPDRPAPRPSFRTRGTPGGGDGGPSSGGTATHRCRCAACRAVPRRPSTAACGRRWSGRCPRRGGAVRRAVPGPTGTRRAFSSSAEIAARCRVDRTAGAVPLTGSPPWCTRRRAPPRLSRSRRGGGRRGGSSTSRPARSPATTPAAFRMRRCWLTSGCGTASASTSSWTQHDASCSCSTMAMRTGAASARSRSPAVSSTSRGGSRAGGQWCRCSSTSAAPAVLEIVFIMMFRLHA